MIAFDIEVEQHRKWYAEFRATASWKHCPVRFASKPGLTVVATIEQQVIDYYLSREDWTK